MILAVFDVGITDMLPEIYFLSELNELVKYLSQVKRVPSEMLSFFKGHNLDVKGPRGEVPACNGVVQVTGGIIRVCASYDGSCLWG